MDIQRSILIVALAVVSYLMVLQWNEDYGQAALPAEVSTSTAATPALPDTPAATASAGGGEDRGGAASDAGRGFVVPEDEVVAQTKNGKGVLNLADKERAQAFAVVPDGANSVAVLSEGRKLLIFPLDEVPEMGRGRGVLLQKSKGDRLADAQAREAELKAAKVAELA